MGVKKHKSEIKAFCLLPSAGSPAGPYCFSVLQPVWAISFVGKKEAYDLLLSTITSALQGFNLSCYSLRKS